MDISPDTPEATEDAEQPSRVASADFVKVQTLAIEANERIEKDRVRVQAGATDENRRMIALAHALCSLGVGVNQVHTSGKVPETREILGRAREFDAFLRGQEPGGEIIPIRAVNAPESGGE